MIILPRQARDRHRESTQKEMRLSQGVAGTSIMDCHVDGWLGVSESGLFEPFLCINDLSTKTGSVQTQGKLKTDRLLSGGAAP
jgi:hypothetical protein